jgi:nicotinamide riboside transporter PnuC
MIDKILYKFFAWIDSWFEWVEKEISETKTKKKGEKKMIKNYKDIVVLLITVGVLILLGTIIIGDYIVALEENRPVDESVITLMKMSVTGLIGVIGGYIGGSK